MSNTNDFTIKKGVLTEYCGKSLIVVVPDGVTEIGIGGLGNPNHYVEALEKVVLPDSVRKIRKNAFFSKLARAYLKDSFETQDTALELYLPKEMNIPKDFLKQKDLDLKVVKALLAGPWYKVVTEEDCLALLENYDRSELPEWDLPTRMMNRIRSKPKKIPEKPSSSLSSFRDPAPYRDTECVFLRELEEECPSHSIDKVKKQLYVRALILAGRFGFESVEDYLIARGYTPAAKNKKIKTKSIEESFGNDERGVFEIPSGAFSTSFDKTGVEPPKPLNPIAYDEKKQRCEKIVEQIRNLMENTPGVDPWGYGETIWVNEPFFNERTDLETSERINKDHKLLNTPYGLLSRSLIEENGYHFSYAPGNAEFHEKKRMERRYYMAEAALYIYPGSNVYLEVHDVSDNFFATPEWWEKHRKEHPERRFLVVNMDTGAEIRTLPAEPKISKKDCQGEEYAKVLKQPVPDTYYEIGMEDSDVVWRLKKEIIDGRNCLCGVPLDQYSFIRFDEKLNRYMIQTELRKDFVAGCDSVGKNIWKLTHGGKDYEIKVREELFSFERLMPMRDIDHRNFPEIPKKRELLAFLNKLYTWHNAGQVVRSDLESFLLTALYYPTSAGLLKNFDVQLRTSSGQILHVLMDSQNSIRLSLEYCGY